MATDRADRRAKRPKPERVKRVNITLPADVWRAIESEQPHINVSAICTAAILDYMTARNRASTDTVTLELPGVGPVHVSISRVEVQ